MEQNPYYLKRGYHPPYVGRLTHKRAFRGFHLHANGDFCEITLVLRGRVRHILNGSARLMERGDVTFLLPKDVHQYIVESDDAETLNVSFAFDGISAAVWQTLDIGRLPLNTRLGETAIASVLDTVSLTLGGAEAVLLREGAVTETLLGWLAYRVMANGEITPREPSPIRLAVRHIQSRFRTPLCEREVAAQVHFSPSHFSTLFRREMGVSFRTYLRDLRLEYARELLRLPGYTVARAREESGFDSPEYFSRAFRARYGMPPSAVLPKQHGTEK